ncbi:MAG: class I SAM-dependent methyltransferase [Candidatus ainarchaeum sp.]|nr:class I SAM-dependent methyltransferase [Candidatus ainarchaeum sp.]
MRKRKSSSRISFRGKKLSCSRETYLPCDDSFLLAQAVASRSRGDVLDMGTGCGIQGIAAAGKAKSVLFADISPEAVECARKNAEMNGATERCVCRFVESDLFDAIPEAEKFDVIIFNPPYLPTKPGERVKGAINSAWDGGRDGRRVIDPFLGRFGARLKEGGILLYLDCQLSGTRETKKRLKESGFRFRTVARKRAGNERLSVLLAWK